MRGQTSQTLLFLHFWLIWSKPESQISDIPLHMFQFFWLALYSVAGRLLNKTRTTAIGIPVVVHEMMKTGFRNSSPKLVPIGVRRLIERDQKIEWPPGDLAEPGCNDASTVLISRSPDRAFVWMGGKVLDHTGRR